MAEAGHLQILISGIPEVLLRAELRDSPMQLGLVSRALCQAPRAFAAFDLLFARKAVLC